jgi:hypothetical protein
VELRDVGKNEGTVSDIRRNILIAETKAEESPGD